MLSVIYGTNHQHLLFTDISRSHPCVTKGAYYHRICVFCVRLLYSQPWASTREGVHVNWCANVCQCALCILSSLSRLLCTFSPSQVQRGEPCSDLTYIHTLPVLTFAWTHYGLFQNRLPDCTATAIASSLISITESCPSHKDFMFTFHHTEHLPHARHQPRGLLAPPRGMSGVTLLFQGFN